MVSYIGDFSVLGTTRTIEILEVDTNVLDITKDGLKWPPNLPSPDGAMLCFKHGDPKAIGELTTLLSKLPKAKLHVLYLLTDASLQTDFGHEAA